MNVYGFFRNSDPYGGPGHRVLIYTFEHKPAASAFAQAWSRVTTPDVRGDEEWYGDCVVKPLPIIPTRATDPAKVQAEVHSHPEWRIQVLG